MINEEDKIYFVPGDLCQIKHDLPNKPIMMVVRKETSIFKNKEDQNGILKGIRCRWFTTSGQLQEAVWNTKDLIKLT